MNHPKTSITLLMLVLLTFTLMMGASTSIILIAIDFISKADHFGSPTRAAYSINLMMIFFLAVLPGHLIGQKIETRNAIILAAIFSTLGLILLSLANMPALGTAIFVLGLSTLYINYLNLTVQLLRGHERYLDLGLFAFFYCAIIGLLLGVVLQKTLSHWLNNANTYLLSGILTVFALLIFIFLNHFFLSPEPSAPEGQHTKRPLKHASQTAWVALVSIALIALFYHIPTLTRLFVSGLILCIAIHRWSAMRRSDYAVRETVYFCIFLVSLAFWTLSGIENFLFNNIRSEKFWLYTFTQWYSLNTLKIAFDSAVLNFLAGFSVPLIYWFNQRSKRPLSYGSQMSLACLVLGLGQISLWLPTLLNASNTQPFTYLLPFHWIIFYELSYSTASIWMLCSVYSLCSRLFIQQSMKFIFVELTALIALVWLLIGFISNLISWEVSQVSLNSWRAIYPGISGSLGLCMLLLAIGLFILSHYLQRRYRYDTEFKQIFWQTHNSL